MSVKTELLDYIEQIELLVNGLEMLHYRMEELSDVPSEKVDEYRALDMIHEASMEKTRKLVNDLSGYCRFWVNWDHVTVGAPIEAFKNSQATSLQE